MVVSTVTSRRVIRSNPISDLVRVQTRIGLGVVMISRRGFLYSAASLLLVGSKAWAASNRVRLVLVRDSRELKSCEHRRYMPGRLYAASDRADLADVSTTQGLEFISRTEEPPYLDNAQNLSSIPTGTYDARIRTEQTKRWMKGKPNRAWRLELLGTESLVPERTRIQFHYGRDYTWSVGCIILTGESMAPRICHTGSDSSEEAVVALRRRVERSVNTNGADIQIKIMYA